MKERFRNLRIWVMAFVFAVAVIAVYKTFDNFGMIWDFLSTVLGILSPFVVGFGIAFLLYAPSNWLEKFFRRRKIPFIGKHARGFSICIVYLLLFGLIALILTFALPALINGVTDFVNMLIRELPPLYEQLMQWLAQYTEPGGILEDVDIQGKLQEVYNYILSNVTVDKVLQSLSGVISFTSSLLNVFMSFIISVYMLASRESLLRALRAVLGLFMKKRWIDLGASYAHKVGDIFYGYLYSQALDACIIGVIVTVGLVIFQVPSAPLLGMMVGFMNMIPYFGAIIGGCFCVLIALLGGNIWSAVGVAVYILAMQQLDGNIIQPRIVGHTIGVKPIYVLLAITLGGGLFGFWGIFFGVPVMATVQLLINDIIAFRDKKRETALAAAGAPDDPAPRPDKEESGEE